MIQDNKAMQRGTIGQVHNAASMPEPTPRKPDSEPPLKQPQGESNVKIRQYFAPLHNLGFGEGVKRIDFGIFSLLTLEPDESKQLLECLGESRLWEPLTTDGYVYLEKKETFHLLPENTLSNLLAEVELAEWHDNPRDVVGKERLLLNLFISESVDTPAVYWADRFPSPTQVRCMLHRFPTGMETAGEYWDGEQDRMVWAQEIAKSHVEPIQKLVKKAAVYLSEEFLEQHPGLKVALDKYAEGCQWTRADKDKIVDFIGTLEALYLAPDSTGVKQKLSQRVSMCLRSETDKREVGEQLIKLYETRSKIVHGDRNIGLPADEEVKKLRNYARLGALVGIALRQKYPDDDQWEAWCSRLDLASGGWSDRKIIQEIEGAWASWSA